MVVNCLPLFSIPQRNELEELRKADNAAAYSSNGGGEGAEGGGGGGGRGAPSDSVAPGSDWVQFSDKQSFHNGRSVPPDPFADASAGSISSPLPPNLTNSLIIPSDVHTFEDSFTSNSEDIFSTVDPFAQATSAGAEDLVFSTRDQALQDAFNQAGGGVGGGEEGGAGGGGEDSDDYLGGSPISHDEIAVSFVEDIQPLKKRCGSVSFVSTKVVASGKKPNETELNTTFSDPQCTPLPPPPPVIVPRYVERGGWAMKLSHRKGTNVLSASSSYSSSPSCLFLFSLLLSPLHPPSIYLLSFQLVLLFLMWFTYLQVCLATDGREGTLFSMDLLLATSRSMG